MPRPSAQDYTTWALLWMAFVIYGSLVPLVYRPVPLTEAIERFTHLPPLWFGLGTRADWVANILLFIPLTFLWMGALTVDRSRRAEALAAALIVPLGFAAAIALEFTQIWFPRTVSRNDIVAEGIGTVVGVTAWVVLGRGFTQWLRTFAADVAPASQTRWLLQAWTLGFIAYSVLPLDLTLSVSELYHKYRTGQVLLIPFSHPYESIADLAYQTFTDVLVFVPVGAWLAMTLPGRSLRIAGVLGGVFALAIELVQLLVVSRYTDVTDILLGTIGALAGAWLVIRFNASPPPLVVPSGQRPSTEVVTPWLAAIVALSLFLVAGFCFPPEFTADRALIRDRVETFLRVPLLSLYRGTEFNATSQVLSRLLFFAPIGALWARVAAPYRRDVRRLVLAVGVAWAGALALGIEGLQLFMPGKVADVTDAILCLLGAIGGMLLTNRVLQAAPD